MEFDDFEFTEEQLLFLDKVVEMANAEAEIEVPEKPLSPISAMEIVEEEFPVPAQLIPEEPLSTGSFSETEKETADEEPSVSPLTQLVKELEAAAEIPVNNPVAPVLESHHPVPSTSGATELYWEVDIVDGIMPSTSESSSQ